MHIEVHKLAPLPTPSPPSPSVPPTRTKAQTVLIRAAGDGLSPLECLQNRIQVSESKEMKNKMTCRCKVLIWTDYA
jgi:hypothetical protein